MRTLVLGLGNPILTDDGVGVRVAESVQARLQQAAAPGAEAPGAIGMAYHLQRLDYADDAGDSMVIDVQEMSVGGLTLMETMIGYERVILIDAMEHPDLPPGAMCRLSLDDLRAISPTQHSASPHDATLVTAFDLGRRMGYALPNEMIIYAIGVANVLDFSDQPTPAVAAAIPQVVAAVLEELRRES
ncbi:MAG: hydrogenase maturation protease [Chloroflexaceae bacterium]|nr:hydrogenase maturation protease [Chloroflexaceae bacterium]